MDDPLIALKKIRALLEAWQPGDNDARFAATRHLIADLIELEAETQFSDFIHEQLVILRWFVTGLYIDDADGFAERRSQSLELVTTLESEQGFGSFDRS